MRITAHINTGKCADCSKFSHSHSITNQVSSHLACEFNLVVDTFSTLQGRKFMEISPRGRLIDCQFICRALRQIDVCDASIVVEMIFSAPQRMCRRVLCF